MLVYVHGVFLMNRLFFSSNEVGLGVRFRVIERGATVVMYAYGSASCPSTKVYRSSDEETPSPSTPYMEGEQGF